MELFCHIFERVTSTAGNCTKTEFAKPPLSLFSQLETRKCLLYLPHLSWLLIFVNHVGQAICAQLGRCSAKYKKRSSLEIECPTTALAASEGHGSGSSCRSHQMNVSGLGKQRAGCGISPLPRMCKSQWRIDFTCMFSLSASKTQPSSGTIHCKASNNLGSSRESQRL